MSLEKTIDSLREMEKKATGGPWLADKAVNRDGTETSAIYHYPHEHHCVEVIETPDKLHGECIHNEADAELITEMRNKITPLLDLIESAEIMRAHLEDLGYEHLNCCQVWDQKIADAFGSV